MPSSQRTTKSRGNSIPDTSTIVDDGVNDECIYNIQANHGVSNASIGNNTSGEGIVVDHDTARYFAGGAEGSHAYAVRPLNSSTIAPDGPVDNRPMGNRTARRWNRIRRQYADQGRLSQAVLDKVQSAFSLNSAEMEEVTTLAVHDAHTYGRDVRVALASFLQELMPETPYNNIAAVLELVDGDQDVPAGSNNSQGSSTDATVGSNGSDRGLEFD